MDEREVIKDIRWDFSRNKSRAEITRKLQKKGLKLEYIDSLIYKSKRPRKIFKKIIIILIVLISIWMSIYAVFFNHSTEESLYQPNWQLKEGEEAIENYTLEINSELISLIASNIGATKLRTNPINLRKPIINFQISGKNFYTVVNKNIETFEGTSQLADLKFYFEGETLEKAFLSENFKEEIKKAISEGSLRVERISSDQELFLKGYLSLYNELK